MANSDNVLRGGMTTKNVNRDELMRVLRFDPISPPIVRAEPLADSSWNAVILHYPTPAQEFRLRRVEIDGSSAVGSGGVRNYARCPQILLCTKGTCRITVEGVETIDAGCVFVVEQGESIWVPAGATVSFTSDGVDARCLSPLDLEAICGQTSIRVNRASEGDGPGSVSDPGPPCHRSARKALLLISRRSMSHLRSSNPYSSLFSAASTAARR